MPARRFEQVAYTASPCDRQGSRVCSTGVTVYRTVAARSCVPLAVVPAWAPGRLLRPSRPDLSPRATPPPGRRCRVAHGGWFITACFAFHRTG